MPPYLSREVLTPTMFLKGLMGNIATSLWFFPWGAIWLHRLRGIRFVDHRKVFIGRNVIMDNRFPEMITVGRNVWICAGSVILSHSYTSEYQKTNFGMDEKTGPVVISDGVFIGVGSIILPGVAIGKGSYVAAGSVVVKDIPEHVLAAGNPARVIRPLDGEKR